MESIYLHSDRGWWAHRPFLRHNGAPTSPGPGTIWGGGIRDVRDTDDTLGTKRSC